MKFRELLEVSIKSDKKEIIKKLYDEYKKDTKNKASDLHGRILRNFVQNNYVHYSNNEIEYMWSLYKADKEIK